MHEGGREGGKRKQEAWRREGKWRKKVRAKEGRSLNDMIYGSKVRDSNVSIREKVER